MQGNLHREVFEEPSTTVHLTQFVILTVRINYMIIKTMIDQNQVYGRDQKKSGMNGLKDSLLVGSHRRGTEARVGGEVSGR